MVDPSYLYNKMSVLGFRILAMIAPFRASWRDPPTEESTLYDCS